MHALVCAPLCARLEREIAHYRIRARPGQILRRLPTSTRAFHSSLLKKIFFDVVAAHRQNNYWTTFPAYIFCRRASRFFARWRRNFLPRVFFARRCPRGPRPSTHSRGSHRGAAHPIRCDEMAEEGSRVPGESIHLQSSPHSCVPWSVLVNILAGAELLLLWGGVEACSSLCMCVLRGERGSPPRVDLCDRELGVYQGAARACHSCPPASFRRRRGRPSGLGAGKSDTGDPSAGESTRCS